MATDSFHREETAVMGKHPTSYRLSAECRALLEQLAQALGISQTGVMEQAIRKLARAELPTAATVPQVKSRRRPRGK